eukprot:m.994892 g.994892  ORF g.994892 m.994892 type:complete len:78 (-) comp24014_c1_seq3:3198-3431(-)
MAPQWSVRSYLLTPDTERLTTVTGTESNKEENFQEMETKTKTRTKNKKNKEEEEAACYDQQHPPSVAAYEISTLRPM